ncbi:unnamed protein product [Prunus armeniaca]|uniref:Uncharacterized protein n=1 Tax=Prunus armeniaca TaxID=36596 RepID=A0A6J5W7G5_PRUAR|nr:unnamed protein product [Prunus armeniaca]
MTWKTDDTFVIASESSLRMVISNGHFGDLAYFDFDTELEQHSFVKSERAEYRHKFGHFRCDCLDLLANIVRESKIEALQAKVFDIESKITQIDGFSDKLDGMLRSFHDK